jgi:ankyrin repeat protein
MTRHTDFSKFTQFGLDCFNLLLKKGADINSQNIYGRTILHNFVTKCDLAKRMARMLTPKMEMEKLL